MLLLYSQFLNKSLQFANFFTARCLDVRFWDFLCFICLTFNPEYYLQKQPSKGVFRKRCPENMQQIYRRTPMSKCNFNNATLCKALISIMKLYWNLTLTCSFYKNTSEGSFLSIKIQKYSSYDHYIRTSSNDVGSKSISFMDCLFIVYFKPLFSR